MAAALGAEGAEVPKAIVKNVDMDEDMQQAVVEIAGDAFVKFELEKDMAASVKRAVDERFGPTWHVVVGKSFGSFVTHGTSCIHTQTDSQETAHFIYFCTQRCIPRHSPQTLGRSPSSSGAHDAPRDAQRTRVRYVEASTVLL